MDEVENKEVDFKSKLIEWVQKEKKVLQFETISDGNTSESRLFIVNANIDNKTLGTAQHFSKKRAEQLAAEQACANLGL
jgi:ribonuclease-3